MDRIQQIDNAVYAWLSTYGPHVKDEFGEDSVVIFARSRREFAEQTSTRDEDTERLRIPRISLMRTAVIQDQERQRDATVRKISFFDDSKTRIFQGPMPVPVVFEYQIDFWSRKESEMNRWIIKFYKDFKTQVKYLKYQVDDIFQQKYLGLLLEGSLDDNSDLEPGEERTLIRYTATVSLPTWLFPEESELVLVPTVQTVTTEYTDEDGNSLNDLNCVQ